MGDMVGEEESGETGVGECVGDEDRDVDVGTEEGGVVEEVAASPAVLFFAAARPPPSMKPLPDMAVDFNTRQIATDPSPLDQPRNHSLSR